MAVVTPAILDALADGVTAITPNRRLARQLSRDFDRMQQTLGRRSWPTPSVLPYATWLESLWQRRGDPGSDDGVARLLTPTQSSHLWRYIVDKDQTELLDVAGAARLSVEAWALVHGWGTGGESWRAWRRDDDNEDDPATFASWAESYARALQAAHAIDAARLPDLLALDAERVDCRNLRVALFGFIEYTPQQLRLHAALAAAGAEIRSLDALRVRAPVASRTTAANARDELVAALTWARALALKQPELRIGVVVEDLAKRRDEMVLLADELLCPQFALTARPSKGRPYELSLGPALDEVPLVMTAVRLISLREATLPAGEAAALLRSPYLPGADEAWVRRAAIERDWLDLGQREVTLDDVVAASRRRSPELATRWQTARAESATHAAATPREWADTWRAWLAGCGWPGVLTLDSAEHQARVAWDALLSEFARLGAVAPRLRRGDALSSLRAMVQERVFQPEGTDARIQLLGVLEGSGLEFDALWVAGLSADRWPAAPAPNPLLPLAWQRERKVPRSSAESELAYARALTSRFATAAPEVVFSHAATRDDVPIAPSTLLLEYPEDLAPRHSARSWLHAIAKSARLEALADDHAPALAAGTTAPGGASIVAAQSDCPFQAVARHRLRAEPWPEPSAGLSRKERGILIHATMAALWNSVRDHATLTSLDVAGRRARVAAAVERGLVELAATRWRNLPAITRAAEARRIAAVLEAWLPLELARPAFSVLGTEVTTTLELQHLTFRLRIDRVDALASGGVTIIDYKSGKSDSPSVWFDPRPRTSQLGLYALAERDAHRDVHVRAVALAQLKPDAIAAIGLAADEGVWPDLTTATELDRFRDWSAVESWWRTHLGALAQEIQAGWAAVAPRRYPSPCRQCGLQSLCRIDSVQLADDDELADD
jgi:ATP-dependent helicase/nuclease subunit B